MDKLATLLAQCDKSLTESLQRKKYDKQLLKSIITSLGPSVYKKDSLKVACSKSSELKRIKTSFLIKKLGLEDGPALDQAIKDVCEEMGTSNRNKFRPVFYYLLVEKFNKQDVFEITSEKSKSQKAKSSKKGSGKDKRSDKKADKEKKTIHIPVTDDIIRRHALFAAGAGLVPIPLVDLASISVVQYRMIKEIAKKYKVEFSDEKTKSVLAGLMGGITSFEAGLLTRILFKGIPIIGPVIGGTAVSGFAYATTKLVGEIFDEHFASGGDMAIEDVTISKMREKLSLNLDKWKKSMT